MPMPTTAHAINGIHNRFNRPCWKSKNKTKLSLRAKSNDAAYMQALDSGDEEKAQRMVDEAAKEAGYTEKAYHGSPSFGFTQFDMEKRPK
jgi:hypothetical protein